MIKRMLTTRSRLARLFGTEGGMAAAEFGLMLPIFGFGLLSMLDVGIAINERMKMDQAIRSSAQLVMTGVDDVTALENAVLSANDRDGSDNGTPTIDTADYSLSITRSCECGGVAGSCTALCGNDDPPSVFYNFDASKTMQTIFIPEFDVGSSLRIQVR